MLGIHGLCINTTKKPFDNAALRQAMNMVINREDIFNQAEAGYFHPQGRAASPACPTPAGDAFIAPEYKGKNVRRSTSRAPRRCSTDAGFKLDGNTLKDPTGKPVTITLTDPAGWSDYQTALEIIKDNLATDRHRRHGRQGQPGRLVQERRQRATSTPRCTGPTAAPRRTTSTRPSWTATLLKPIGTAAPSGNFGRFNSPEATAALKDYANATDDAARTAAMNTLQKIIVEQMPDDPDVGADNVGAEYSTKNWVGWPDEANPYGAGAAHPGQRARRRPAPQARQPPDHVDAASRAAPAVPASGVRVPTPETGPPA